MHSFNGGKDNGIMKKKKHIFIHIIFIIGSLLIILPLLTILGSSFQSQKDIALNGYRIIPKEFSLLSYQMIFKNPSTIVNAYMVTIFTTVAGVIISMLLCTSFAYVLSRSDYRYRKILMFYIFFTMLFNGGMVANYLWVANTLKLKNNIWVLILPTTVSAWNVMLMKGFLSGIPDSIIESARIEGAKELFIYFKIVLPCAKPALATVALFYALTYWNDWYLALLYIDNDKLLNLQSLLQRILKNIALLNSAEAINSGMVSQTDIPTEGVRMAMCIIAAGPMLVVFPFFQKYFVQGLTVGSVKG